LLEVGRAHPVRAGAGRVRPRGAFYLLDASDEQQRPQAAGRVALEAEAPTAFRIGEGLVGQCVREKRGILLETVRRTTWRISSGLGGATPASLIILPCSRGRRQG